MTDKPLHKAFESSARAPSSLITPAFNRAAESIDQKAARITEKAEQHFEKHRNAWTVNRYHELLKKDSPAPALRLNEGNQDRKAHLLRTASHLAHRKHQGRLDRIKNTAERMMGKSGDGLEK